MGLGVQVTGSNFYPASLIAVNGIAQSTTYASGEQLEATLSAAVTSAIGEVAVTVVNPSPGGGTSVPVTLTLYEAINVNAAFLATVPGSSLICIRPLSCLKPDSAFALRRKSLDIHLLLLGSGFSPVRFVNEMLRKTGSFEPLGVRCRGISVRSRLRGGERRDSNLQSSFVTLRLDVSVSCRQRYNDVARRQALLKRQPVAKRLPCATLQIRSTRYSLSDRMWEIADCALRNPHGEQRTLINAG
jgi:hypothetical protein